jgi:hypothetical protein
MPCYPPPSPPPPPPLPPSPPSPPRPPSCKRRSALVARRPAICRRLLCCACPYRVERVHKQQARSCLLCRHARMQDSLTPPRHRRARPSPTSRARRQSGASPPAPAPSSPQRAPEQPATHSAGAPLYSPTFFCNSNVSTCYMHSSYLQFDLPSGKDSQPNARWWCSQYGGDLVTYGLWQEQLLVEVNGLAQAAGRLQGLSALLRLTAGCWHPEAPARGLWPPNAICASSGASRSIAARVSVRKRRAADVLPCCRRTSSAQAPFHRPSTPPPRAATGWASPAP